MYNDGNYGGRFGGGGFNNSRQLTPPVREGQELEVTIEAVGEKGDGIAKVQGFVVFVPNTQAGDRVKVKVTRVLAKVGFGQVLSKADPAPASSAAPPKQEFEANEDLDSEDFGDDDGSESSDEEASSEDDSEEEPAEESEDDASEEETSEDDESDAEDDSEEEEKTEEADDASEESSDEESDAESSDDESSEDESDEDSSEDDESDEEKSE